MRVLSLTQPWATLMALGEKRIETRSWRTSYRGLVAIHAAKGMIVRDCRMVMETDPFTSVLARHGITAVGQLPRGEIIAVVALADCLEIGSNLLWLRQEPSLTDQETAFGNYGEGRYAWLTQSPQRVDPPVSARGALGLQDLGPSLTGTVLERARAVA